MNLENIQQKYKKIINGNRYALAKSALIFIVLLLGTIFATLMFTNEVGVQVTIISLAILAFGTLAAVLRSMFVTDTSTFLIKEVYTPLYEESYTDVTISPSGFSQGLLTSTQAVLKGNSFSSDTYIQLQYEGYRLRMSNVNISNINKEGKVTHTQFAGRWYIMDQLKKDYPYVQISDASVDTESLESSYDLYSIETESINFNQQFHVLTNDEVDGFKVLTPDIMELLMSWRTSLPKEYQIRVVIEHGTVCIGIENIKPITNIKSEHLNQQYIDDIHNDILFHQSLCNSVIHVLKLDVE